MMDEKTRELINKTTHDLRRSGDMDLASDALRMALISLAVKDSMQARMIVGLLKNDIQVASETAPKGKLLRFRGGR